MGGNSSKTEEKSYWRADNECKACEMCEAAFTFLRRRHHCRSCGGLFCTSCSSQKICVPSRGHVTPVRVCNLCKMKGDDTRASQSPPLRRRASDVGYRTKRMSHNNLNVAAGAQSSSTSAPAYAAGGLAASAPYMSNNTNNRPDDTASNHSAALTKQHGSLYRNNRTAAGNATRGGVVLSQSRRTGVLAFLFVLQRKTKRQQRVYTVAILQSIAACVASYCAPTTMFDAAGSVAQSATVASSVRFSNVNCCAYVTMAKKTRKAAPQQRGMFATTGDQYGDDDDDAAVSSRTFLQTARHVVVPLTPMMSSSAPFSVTFSVTLPIKSELEFGDIFDVCVGGVPETEWNEFVLNETDALAVPLKDRVKESVRVWAVDVGGVRVLRPGATDTEESSLEVPVTIVTVTSTPSTEGPQVAVMLQRRGAQKLLKIPIAAGDPRWKLLLSISIRTKGSVGIEIL